MDLFFRHAPEDGKEEDSAYYYWYRFLQLVDEYGPEHPLWKDFGDVKGLPFMDWWCDVGEDLFMTGEDYGVWELETDEDIQIARSEGASIVRIDLGCPADYLMHCFRVFLTEKGVDFKRGSKPHSMEGKYARRSFAKRPDVDALKKSLKAWECRLEDPKLPLYEIACLIDSETEKIDKENDLSAGAKKAEIEQATSRYLRWAEHMIKYVEIGVFPIYSDVEFKKITSESK